MKKLVLTLAIALGMAFTASAQRADIDYDYTIDYDGSYSYYNYGDLHRIENYGDRHYVGSHFKNDDEKDDIFTRLGLRNSSSTSRDTEFYDNDGESYIGGGLLGRGQKGSGLFVNSRGLFSPNLPSHGTEGDADAAPLGSGALLLIGMGAAYALGKKKNKR